MPFADIELARRVERAETRLLADCAAAVAERRTGVLALSLAGGLATHAGYDSPLNKLGGLGFDGIPQAEALAAVEARFAERGTALTVEVASLADPAVLGLLAERGYRLRGFENVLGRPLSADEHFPEPVGTAVERGAPEDRERWLDTIVTGFATPDEQGVPSDEAFPRELLEQAIGDMTRSRGFEQWLALREGALVGAAGLRLCDGVAQLCGAATLPEHRRRGVQTALLFTRLAHAARAGCDLAVVVTQPGSKSQQNAERQGFGLLYVRAVLTLSPGGAAR